MVHDKNTCTDRVRSNSPGWDEAIKPPIRFRLGVCNRSLLGVHMADDLTADEFAMLKQLGVSFSRGTVPLDIKARLQELGYARELMGNLIITDSGSVRLAAGQ